ncbi:MAG TPA: helix-turn-helix domain-containing protein, partial [Clostridia bacterium]|nr:helix-turn-helix domain-containing protein [Clostridia bacterium]
ADNVAERFDVSAQKLNQLYKDHCGQTVAGYIAARRHDYIKRMLISSDIPVRTLALQMGYSQPSSFIRNFKHEEGMPPGEFRARYRKAE